MEKDILDGILHEVSEDIKAALSSDSEILKNWNSLTPIQRNEWICWITIVKQESTRKEHISRMMEQLKEGKRQPCCWSGCPHRRPSAKKYFKNLEE